MSLRAARQRLLEDPALQGLAFCRTFSAEADAELKGLLSNATGDDLQGLALLAVGGYGRSELCPHSDLDVVLVHRQRRDVAKIADSVWYPVWDEGVRLDHSVRTPAEVLSVATEDLRAQLGLLDGRVISGDPEVGEPVLARAREMWRSRAAQWLPVLANQVTLRHRQYGDVAFLLEPDLKEAHGGLRDLSGLHAAVLAAPALSRGDDLQALEPARELLLRVRVELHRRSPRAVEKLLLQDQDAIASALGYEDADALMHHVAAAGRSITWLGDDLWSRSALWQVTRKRRRWMIGGSSSDRSGSQPAASGSQLAEGVVTEEQPTVDVEPGVALSDGSGGRPTGEVVLSAGSIPRDDPTLVLRLAAVAAERGRPIGRRSLEDLSGSIAPPTDPWSENVRDAFVRLLAAGRPAISAIEALDHYNLFTPFLPEWDAVRNKPQRNAYHRFTVDRHLLEATAEAASLSVRVARRDLLLVAALLHDIGKGLPGDHTDTGVLMIERIGHRMGFSDNDVQTLANLVRNHLLLSELATRRDLDDPATISTVTRAVRDRQTLDLLAALTEADSLATGTAAWGTWKAGLVADLVHRAAASLEGDELPPPVATVLTTENRALISEVRDSGTDSRPVILAKGSRVTVVATDRPGLLASVTGVLCLHGLDLRSADVAGDDGVAVEVFSVEPAHGRWPDWEKVSADLDQVLAGRASLADRLAKRSKDYGRGQQSYGPVELHVKLDNAASAGSTVVEIRAPDEMALLHRVTSVLFDNDLDVVAARACTLGDHVVDAFYVRDRSTKGKVEDPTRLKEIKTALDEALAAMATGNQNT